MPVLIKYNGLGGKLRFSGTSIGGFKARYISSAAPLLLDAYPGAAAAYSLRKLSSTYNGSAIRVRRSSDNAETDIGFVNNELDTASLLSFCGAGNGFVTTWYDQSGNAINATQATSASQPQIVNLGVINLQGTKPAILFDGSTNSLFFSPLLTVSTLSNFSIFRNTKGGPVGRIWSLAASTGNDYANSSLSATLYVGSTFIECIRNNNVVNSTITISTYACITTIFDGTNKKIKGNTASFTSNASTGNFGATIGCIGYNAGTSGALSPQDRFGGNMLEQIYYYSDQTSNNTAIESNINSYYTIY